MTSPVNVDVKLGVNKFNVDEEHPHIVVKADADKQALELLVKACPAGLYRSRMTAVCASITPDVWSAAPVAFWGWGRRWNSGNTRAAPLVWSSVTADVGLIRNAVLTLIAKNRNNPCNRPETLTISNSPQFTAAFCCGEAVVRFWMVMYW